MLLPRTWGPILVINRELYGLEKPKRGSKEKKGNAVSIEQTARDLELRHPLR
jgi:hypothetical protein